MRLLPWLVALVTLLSVSLPAQADIPHELDKDRAAELKLHADDAMTSRRYDEALAKYEEAYKLDPQPALLYNQGRALQVLGRYPEALAKIESFNAQAPEELKKKVPKLDALIVELKGKVATLELKCNVEGARVLVRGQHVGETPLAKPLALNAGEAEIEVRKEGYHPVKRKLSLPGGQSTALSVELRSRQTTGVLRVDSPVAGAEVFVDGARIGKVPAETIVPAGKHRVVVRHEGFEPAETTMVVEAGGTRRVNVPLEEPPRIYQRWWFWTAVGGAVAVGAAIGIGVAATTERSPDAGTIPPGTISAPLITF